MTKTLKEELTENLPYGYSTKLAERFKVTPEYIRQVKAGTKNNDAILVQLITIAKKNKAKKDLLRNKIKTQLKK